MILVSCCSRHVGRFRSPMYFQSLSWRNCTRIAASPSAQYRSFSKTISKQISSDGKVERHGIDPPVSWEEYKRSFKIPQEKLELSQRIPLVHVGKKVTAAGFLGKSKTLSAGLMFTPLIGGSNPVQIQLTTRRSDSKEADEAADVFETIRPNSSVVVSGRLQLKYVRKNNTPKSPVDEMGDKETIHINDLEIKVEGIQCINPFPSDIIVGPAQKFGPESRHLEIRFEHELRDRLRFRSKVLYHARLCLREFEEIETPILFKSTPEGAREFLVPTRRAGYAYALPQSPQQYKQILMASGIARYVQFARCFRDEDLRADRQPEFTQIDLEMAWTDANGVMLRVEEFIKDLYKNLSLEIVCPIPASDFPRITYDEAMSKHGSDKPDIRIHDLIHRIDNLVPQDLKGMLTYIKDPIIEACKIRLDGDIQTVQKFVKDFMDSPEAEDFKRNPDGAPGIFVYDLRRPLQGLQAFGFEGAEDLKDFYSQVPQGSYGFPDPRGRDIVSTFDSGDLLLLQARPNLPHTGGSTYLGKLRLAIYNFAIAQGLLAREPLHRYLWVTDFPMFTLDNSTDPGQGGKAGFSATHHPFTAPKTAVDVDLLLTEPLKARAAHYDLVVNGVELGGGSQRIHNAEMQKFIMRDILKMSEERMKDFSHLFEALRAGCPPHAGLAIGFDRMIAVMLGRESVKDVIAFPKNNRGEDVMVRSPTLMTESQQKGYHLRVEIPKKSGEIKGEA